MSTEKPRFGHCGYLRWLNALLFSLNSALLLIPVASVRMKYPVLMIGRRIRYFVYAHWSFPIPLFARAADPYTLDFAALVLSSAGLLFLLFVMTARLRAGSNFLRPVPGVVAVVGLPSLSNSFKEFLSNYTLSQSPPQCAYCSTFTGDGDRLQWSAFCCWAYILRFGFGERVWRLGTGQPILSLGFVLQWFGQLLRTRATAVSADEVRQNHMGGVEMWRGMLGAACPLPAFSSAVRQRPRCKL